ncbi:class I SAM-dependent methyltransferase [Flexivirga sp. B27]
MQTTDYDAFAESYARQNETGLLHKYYERPAMLDLAGDVRGRHILDAGCGSGATSEALQERGAVMTGFDLSPVMVDIARRRLGADADLHVADLGAPLPFADNAFDDVVASLSLHYLQDWAPPLAELRRVLKPGGRLLLSVPHPTVYLVNYMDDPERNNYFAVTQYSETFEFDGQEGTLTYWHRPLHAMTDAFTEAGYAIKVLAEPPYAKDTPPELLRPELRERSAFLCFIFFVLEAV